MKNRKYNKENYEMIIFMILFIILFCIGMIMFSNWRKDNCLKNGGKVVETNFGIMEKCIRG